MSLPTGRPRGLAPDGPEIRRLRVDRGLTTKELAVRIGLHPKSLSRIECQGRRISDVSASRLARALGVKVKDLLAGEPEPEPEPGPEALAS